jgi:F-type H+-transporting ATPase subunit gamma
MANLKEVRNRIASVKSTQQITKAMKMVAASKLRKAQDAIMQMRPYAERLRHIRQNVTAWMDGDDPSPFSEQREVERVLMIVLTSDRGLCGAFNSNAIKMAVQYIQEYYPEMPGTDRLRIMPIGKKANDYFRKRDYNVIDTYAGLFQDTSFDKVKEAAVFVSSGFLNGSFDRVHLVYNEFKNVATQELKVEQYLPLQPAEMEEQEARTKIIDYIFEPSASKIIEELIPKTLNIQLFKAVLESHASEHGARMTAMDQATENAGELLGDLRLLYNQTRQATITKELSEIVGGAEALANG